MDNIFDDEEIIEGSIYDIFHSMDKDMLKARAEGDSNFSQYFS